MANFNKLLHYKLFKLRVHFHFLLLLICLSFLVSVLSDSIGCGPDLLTISMQHLREALAIRLYSYFMMVSVSVNIYLGTSSLLPESDSTLHSFIIKKRVPFIFFWPFSVLIILSWHLRLVLIMERAAFLNLEMSLFYLRFDAVLRHFEVI